MSSDTIIVEGQMDVISSHQVGVTNVVAASGCNLTPDQMNLIRDVGNPLLFRNGHWTDWFKFSRGYYYAEPDGTIEMFDNWTVTIYRERERDWRRTRPRYGMAKIRRMFFPNLYQQSKSRLDAQTVKGSCDPVAVYLALGGKPPRFPDRDRVQVSCLMHGEDKRPSMVIYRKDCGFRCHACSESGDIFDLTRKVLGVSFPDAVKFVNDNR
jgi:hypothetical protein